MKNPNIKEGILYVSICKNCKTRQSQSIMVEVGIMVIFGEKEETLGTRRWHRKSCYDAGDILFFDLSCGYLYDSSLCDNLLICTNDVILFCMRVFISPSSFLLPGMQVSWLHLQEPLRTLMMKATH